MLKNDLAIALDPPVAVSEPCIRTPSAATEALVTGTSLISERCGLLAGPVATVTADRKMEEWIASNLDLDLHVSTPPRSAWNRIIDNLPGLRRGPGPSRS